MTSSPSTVVSIGFGTFGSPSDVVTLGFGVGAAAPPFDFIPSTGGRPRHLFARNRGMMSGIFGPPLVRHSRGSAAAVPDPHIAEFGLIGGWAAQNNMADSIGHNHWVTRHDLTTQTNSVVPFVDGKHSRSVSWPSEATHGVRFQRTHSMSTAFAASATHGILMCGWAKWSGLGSGLNVLIDRAGNWRLSSNGSDISFTMTHDGSTYFGPVTASSAITLDTWTFWAVYYDGVNIGLSINGGAWTSSAFGTAASPSDSAMHLGAGSNGANPFYGVQDSIVFGIDPPLGVAVEKDTFRDYFYNAGAGVDVNSIGTPYTGTVIFCDGDSTTAGTGADSGSTPLAGTYPDRLSVLRNAPVYNFGIGGQTLVDMRADGGTTIDVFRAGVTGTPVLVVFGGINDINTGAQLGSTAYARLQGYCQDRIAGGWPKSHIFVCTLTYFANHDDQRLLYNAAILANGNVDWGGVIDFGGQSPIGSSGDSAYYSDPTHPNSDGYQILAQQVSTILAAAGY